MIVSRVYLHKVFLIYLIMSTESSCSPNVMTLNKGCKSCEIKCDVCGICTVSGVLQWTSTAPVSGSHPSFVSPSCLLFTVPNFEIVPIFAAALLPWCCGQKHTTRKVSKAETRCVTPLHLHCYQTLSEFTVFGRGNCYTSCLFISDKTLWY